MKNKTVTVSLDDITIDISLEKIIKREVEKRLKENSKPVEKLDIHISGRRQGNTYRAILYAQLLASNEPYQNVVVLCHTTDAARHYARVTADVMNASGVSGFKSNAFGKISLPNGSTISFTTRNNFEEVGRYALKNLQVIEDDLN